MKRPRVFLLALASAWAAVPPVAGDWLVTRDGARIETAGTWQVKGSQVIFTLPGGRLSALRAADVDLEASAAETRRAAAAETAAAETATSGETSAIRVKRPRRAFTNDNVGETDDSDDTTDEATGTADSAESVASEAPAAEEPTTSEPVELESWDSREGDDGLEIHGILRNTGDSFAADLRLMVTVPGEVDEPPLTPRAFLDSSALAPGASTRFRVLLPGIWYLPDDPAFSIRSDGFTVGGQIPEATPEGEGGFEEFEDEFDGEG